MRQLYITTRETFSTCVINFFLSSIHVFEFTREIAVAKQKKKDFFWGGGPAHLGWPISGNWKMDSLIMRGTCSNPPCVVSSVRD